VISVLAKLIAVLFPTGIGGFLRSGWGLVLIAGVFLFVYHNIDKGKAVRDATIRYLASTEIAALESEKAALQRVAERERNAAAALGASLSAALRQAEEAEDEIRRFQTHLDALGQSGMGDVCTVDADLAGRLRAK
jgi:hypothetical protein